MLTKAQGKDHDGLCAQSYRTVAVSLPDQKTRHPPCASVSLPPSLRVSTHPLPGPLEHIFLNSQICTVPSSPQPWLEFKSPPSATGTLSPPILHTEATKAFSEPKTDHITMGSLLWSLLSLG